MQVDDGYVGVLPLAVVSKRQSVHAELKERCYCSILDLA